MKANSDRKTVVFKSRIDLFAIIANGIKYRPIPSDIEVIDTFNQFSLTIPAAIKTVPHTGGVIVDSNANQKTNKWTWSNSKPISTSAGPATETQITYAAVVGTSIPRIKQAKPVNSKAGHILLSEIEIISDVSFTPNPVIDKTPIIIEAHKIIEPIKEICFPEEEHALKNLFNPNLKSKPLSKLKKRSKKEAKIATEAEYWGVKPINIKNSNVEKGIRKKNEVITTIDFLGKNFASIGFKLYFLL